jgi:endonuclease/exonuclease/phosphatase (EEP) superfamily protein YafD
LCVAFAALVLGATVVLWWDADVGWAGTLLLFAPRWLFALPAVIVLPLTLWARHRGMILLTLATTLVALGPLSGGRVNRWGQPPEGRFRVVTFNADGKLAQREQFRNWFRSLAADLLVIQDAGRLDESDLPEGWTRIAGAGGRWVASRYPLTAAGELADPVLGEIRGAQRVQVASPIGEFIVVNMHLPTPRHGLEAVIHRVPNWPSQIQEGIAHRSHSSQAIAKWVGPPTSGSLVAGDFNLPPESTIYRRDWSNWLDAFETAGLGWGFTMHARWSSVRIDRILFTEPWQCQAVWVGPALGSAHRPVVADFTYGDAP